MLTSKIEKILFDKKEMTSNFLHKENPFVDFDKERLIYHMCSNEGPKIEKGDLNGDNFADIIISASKGYDPTILLSNGKNYKIDNKNNTELFEKFRQ